VESGARDLGAPAGFSDLAGAFDRLLTVGSFYPPEHVQCRDVAAEFRRQLVSALGGRPALRITVVPDGIMMQSERLESRVPGVRRIGQLLSSLAVDRMEIDASVALDELLAFAALMIKLRLQAMTSSRFGQFDFKDFPPSIRIHQREFGKRLRGTPVKASGRSGAEAAVAHVLHALQGLKASDEKPAAWLEMVEGLLKKAVTRVDTSYAPGTGPQGGFARSLDQVLDLGAEAIQRAAVDLFSQAGDGIDELQSLFFSAEKALALSDNPETMEIMLDVLRKAARESGEPAEDSSPREEIEMSETECELSVSELCGALEDYAPASLTLEMTASGDRSEMLRILLEFLFQKTSEKTSIRVREEIVEQLSGDLTPGERSALVTALKGLAVAVDRARIDIYLPFIVHSLRQFESRAATAFLVELCGDRDPEVLGAVWPHLVNEALLCAEPLTSPLTGRLHELIAEVPRDLILKEAHRLYAAETLGTGEISKDLMRPPVPQLCSVFECLLFSPRADLIGSVLLRGLQARPPDWPEAAALGLIPTYATSRRAFLIEVLRALPTGDRSSDLEEMAGSVILERLPALTRRQRSESWTPRAIEALGRLKTQGSDRFLEAIMKGRRLWIFPDWPGPCRAAARRARRMRLEADTTDVAPAAVEKT